MAITHTPSAGARTTTRGNQLTDGTTLPLRPLPWFNDLVELLPLDCEDTPEYVGFNVNREYDVLDMERSTYWKPNEAQVEYGWMSSVISFEMDVGPVAGKCELFRVPQLTYVFCTGTTVRWLTEQGITGWTAGRVFPPSSKSLLQAQRFWETRYELSSPMHFGSAP